VNKNKKINRKSKKKYKIRKIKKKYLNDIYTKFINKPIKEIYYSDKKCQIFQNCKEFKKKVHKIVLIVIIKNENLYIKEFVQHYFSIGIDNIIICDNNDIDGEKIEDILYNFINNGFVKIINYRGKKNYQIISYQEVYLKYINNYDWFMFFDADEFLILPKNNNINDLFNEINYNNFDIIHVNWIYYYDNELIYYDNRSLQMKFKKPRYIYNNKNKFLDSHIKSIIKTGFFNLKWRGNPHTPSGKFKVCDINGKKINNSPFSKKNQAILNNMTIPFLKHFSFKTIEEYFSKKLPKGRADLTEEQYKKITLPKKLFFEYNDWNKVKDNIANKLIIDYFKKYKIKKKVIKEIN